MVTEIMTNLRETLTAQLTASALDADAIEAELGRLRAEQKNLASAVARAGHRQTISPGFSTHLLFLGNAPASIGTL